MQVNRIESSVKGCKTLSLRVKQSKSKSIQVNRIKSSIKWYKIWLSRIKY